MDAEFAAKPRPSHPLLPHFYPLFQPRGIIYHSFFAIAIDVGFFPSYKQIARGKITHARNVREKGVAMGRAQATTVDSGPRLDDG